MKKKRDILFLCQFFYPEYISSAQLPYDTVLALRDAGFSVGALCGYPREYAEGGKVPTKEDANGIRIHRLKYIQTGRSGFLGRIVNYFSFTFPCAAAPAGDRQNTGRWWCTPTRRFCPGSPHGRKSLFGTKLVFVSYDLYPEVATVTNTLREGSMICRLMNHINKCVFRRADRVVALSSEQRDCILRTRNAADELVTVIPNWYRDEGGCARPGGKPVPGVDGGAVRGVLFRATWAPCRIWTPFWALSGRCGRRRTFSSSLPGTAIKWRSCGRSSLSEGIENVRIYSFLHGQDFQDALAVSDCALVSLEKGATGLCVPSKTYSYMMQGIPLLAIMDECDIVRDIQSGAGLWVRNGESERPGQGHPLPAGQPGESPGHAQKMPGAISAKVYHRNLHGKIYISFPGTFAPGNGGGE